VRSSAPSLAAGTRDRDYMAVLRGADGSEHGLTRIPFVRRAFDARHRKCFDRIRAASWIPGGPAFRVKPSVRPRLGSERQHHGAGCFRLAAPRASTGWGWIRIYLQPFDDSALELDSLDIVTRETAEYRQEVSLCLSDLMDKEAIRRGDLTWTIDRNDHEHPR
jgi:hypothetical protein